MSISILTTIGIIASLALVTTSFRREETEIGGRDWRAKELMQTVLILIIIVLSAILGTVNMQESAFFALVVCNFTVSILGCVAMVIKVFALCVMILQFYKPRKNDDRVPYVKDDIIEVQADTK